MLNVNNRAIINRITLRMIKANKTRNIFIVIAIALTTLLITAVFSIGMSYMKTDELQKIRIMGTTAHAALTRPTSEQLEKLKTLDYIKTIGKQYYVAKIENTPEMRNMSLSLFRYEESEWENHRKGAVTDFTGNLPQKYNEVMMPLWVLNTMGIENPQIGMEIPIQYRYDNEENVSREVVILSAYFKDYLNIRTSNINCIFVSDEFAKASGHNITDDGSVTITFKDVRNIADYCDRLEQDMVLLSGQAVKPVPIYDVTSDDKSAAAAGLAVIVIIILFSGYLLIYNLLCISVMKDIRFYGLLKTIGTTPKQLRRIVSGQTVMLSGIGIPVGLIIGALMSFAVVPAAISVSTVETGAAISFNPLIFIGAALFSFVTVWISTVKPARMAGKITPVEAVRFTSRTISKKNKRGADGGKVYRMAFANIFRDRKRAFVVFTSLFLGLTVYLVVNTVLSSMDIDNLIAEYMENDFILENGTFGVMNNNSELAQKFDDEFLDAVRNMDGVTKVETILLQSCDLDFDADIYYKHIQSFEEKYKTDFPSKEEFESGAYPFYGYLVGVDTQSIEELNETLETPIDIEAFRRGEIALFGTGDPSLFPLNAVIRGQAVESVNGFEFQLGGFVPFSYKILRGGLTPNTYISQEAFVSIVDNPIIYKVCIDAKADYLPAILDKLKSMTADDNDILIESGLERKEMLQSQKRVMYILGTGISIILALIGILNFVNIMVTSVTVRSVELAMLESIGMTKKQLKNMLMFEGIWYFVISTALVMSLGTGIAFGIYTLFKQQATYAIFSYPAVPITLSLAVVLTVCVCTPILSFKSGEKATIVERLRKAE